MIRFQSVALFEEIQFVLMSGFYNDRPKPLQKKD